MKQRIITALVLILVCLPPLYFGGVSLRILIFSVAALASYEMVSITGDPKKPNWGMILFLFASIVVQYNVPEDYFPMASAFLIIALFTIVILLMPVRSWRTWPISTSRLPSSLWPWRASSGFTIITAAWS
jgi:CDP-diglyceride synthetase